MSDELKLDESKGEVICPVCNGTGKIPSDTQPFSVTVEGICDRCQGKRKLDWVERITGVAPNTDAEFSIGDLTSSCTCAGVSISDELYKDFEKQIVDRAAKELAEKIDKELIEAIAYPWEQIKKKHFKGGFE